MSAVPIGSGKHSKIGADSDPATYAEAITTDDDNDLDNPGWLYVGGSGNAKVMPLHSDTAVTYVGLVAGTVLPVIVRRVYSTGTTATSLVLNY